MLPTCITMLYYDITYLHYYISKLSNKHPWSQNNVNKLYNNNFFHAEYYPNTTVLSKVITNANGSNSHDKL